MRSFLPMLSLALSSALGTIPHVANAQNLILNPDFESRNAVPFTRHNVGPYISAGVNTHYDDLKVWDALPTHVISGTTGSTTIATTYNNGGSYLSTDGVGDGAISSLGVAPHSGLSSVLIQQHDQNGDHNYDEFVTQQLAQPLLAGHRYEVKFWAIRPQPGVEFRTKLAFYVTNASPFYDLVDNSPTKYALVPSPDSKVLVSRDIQADDGWVLVSGFINIPANETTNQWVTIGYDRSNQYRDTSIPNTVANGALNYFIDDVSLVDMGCISPTMPQVQAPDWTCVDGSRGPVFVYVDDYNPAYTYTITTTRNIVLFGGSTITSITSADGRTRWRFQIRSTVAGGTGTVSVTATNSCGNNTTTFNVTSPSCSAASGATLAYPNPARESLTVPEDVKKAMLLNSQGRAVQQSDASGKLNVQSLPDGLYNLQMQQDGKLINQRIEVKH